MPEIPNDKLSLCKPPMEFEAWSSEDPRDAIDQFYKQYPEECENRINAQTWNEAYCT